MFAGAQCDTNRFNPLEVLAQCSFQTSCRTFACISGAALYGSACSCTFHTQSHCITCLFPSTHLGPRRTASAGPKMEPHGPFKWIVDVIGWARLFPVPSMSKRLASTPTLPRQRKRNRNGVSMSKGVLEPVDTVGTMRVWHANAEYPTVIRESSAPFPTSQCSPPVKHPTTTHKPNAPILDSQGSPPAKLSVEFEQGLDVADPPPPVTPRSKRKRTKRKKRNDTVCLLSLPKFYPILTSITAFLQTKMEAWVTRNSIMLDELVRHDGLKDHDSLPTCAHCLDDIGSYRCLECPRTKVYCLPCTLQRHEDFPLHRIEV